MRPFRITQSGLMSLLALVCSLGLLVSLSMPAFAQATAVDVQVNVIDNDDIISAADEELLKERTAQLSIPKPVNRVVYLAFDKNSGNINNDVKNYGLERDPTLISADRDSFASGVLIIAVGLNPRQVGMYCGNDVCQALDLFEGAHLNASIEEMKPGLRRGNYAIGMMDGVKTAFDPSAVAYDRDAQSGGPTSEPLSRGAFFGIFGSIFAVIAAVWAAVLGFIFGGRIKKARAAYEHLRDSMGNVALELDEVNVRANSLSSPLANAKMRAEWEEVVKNFLAIRETTNLVEGWKHEPTRMQLFRHASDLLEADERVTQMETAQNNINDLFEMEQGNVDIRQQKLVELGWDITEAISSSADEYSREDLKAIKAQATALEAQVADPTFMTDYARLIGEYQNVLAGIAKREYGEAAMQEQDAPTIYDADWRVGMGYNNWVPYAIMHSHYTSYYSSSHDSDWSSGSSDSFDFGGGNSSFSGGFSGGGGSSSW